MILRYYIAAACVAVLVTLLAAGLLALAGI